MARTFPFVDRVKERVQLHPATSYWMQGDRYGQITGYTRRKGAWMAWVRLERSGRTVRVHPDNLLTIN